MARLVSEAQLGRGWLRRQASAVQTIRGSSQRAFSNQALQDAYTDVFPHVEQSPRLRHRETEAWRLVELSADSHDECDSRPDIAPVCFGDEHDVWNRVSGPSETCGWLTEMHDGSSSFGRPWNGRHPDSSLGERWHEDNRGCPQLPIGETPSASLR